MAKKPRFFTVKISSWVLYDPEFSKKYSAFIPISKDFLTSKVTDLISVSAFKLMISIIEQAHVFKNSTVTLNKLSLNSHGTLFEDLLTQLEENQLLTILNKEINKERKKEIKDGAKAPGIEISIGTEYNEPVNTGKVKNKKYSAEIGLLYEKYYPRKEGRTKGVEKLVKEIKNEEDLGLLQIAIKNYASKSKGSEKQFIKTFKTFAGEWRDFVDYVNVTELATEVQADSKFSGVAGVS